MGDYRQYIEKHRIGVVDTWEEVLRPQVEIEGVGKHILEKVDDLVYIHDQSKLSAPEYQPYSDHYMNPDLYTKDSKDYRAAWNHHQNTNPHHWQYWVLLEDAENPKVVPLEIPLEYVLEMLCDWQSASNHYGNTAHWWYETQKDNMKLNPKTRELVEYYLKFLN